MPVTGVWMPRISPARGVAFSVLEAVSEGGYASDILRERSEHLNTRDAALASQIVFGCLRYQKQLDCLIFRYSGRKIDQLDREVTIALRAAIYQLRYLERVPAHAAVHEAVEWIKHRKRAAAGLINAVLRKVNREPVEWPDLETELSCPAWLLARWSQHFCPKQARLIAQAALEEPVAYIRVPQPTELPTGTIVEPTSVPGCFRLLSDLPARMRLHDISSQAIVPLLDLEPGDRFLDLCSAPGNKLLQALESPLETAIACDISLKRLRDVPAVCPRVVLDATASLPFVTLFDHILIDAPCSGTGTLGRNPEIKWRVQEQDFGRFQAKQVQIVEQALPLLAPGGKLVYASCSLEREENEEVIAHVLAAEPGVRCEREMWRLPGRDPGDGFYAAVLRR